MTVNATSDTAPTPRRMGFERGDFVASPGKNFIISSCFAASDGIDGLSTHLSASGSA